MHVHTARIYLLMVALCARLPANVVDSRQTVHPRLSLSVSLYVANYGLLLGTI